MEIEDPFRTLRNADDYILGFHAPSPILHAVYAELLKKFDHITREIIKTGPSYGAQTIQKYRELRRSLASKSCVARLRAGKAK